MMTQRWTIRTVPIETIEIIRSLSHTTGKSAGRLVNEAILSWVRNQPESEICAPSNTTSDWDSLLLDLEKQIGVQSELVRELLAYFGVPYSGDDRQNMGGRSGASSCLVGKGAIKVSTGSRTTLNSSYAQ